MPGGPLGTAWNLLGNRLDAFSGEIDNTYAKLVILGCSWDAPGCPWQPRNPQKSIKNWIVTNKGRSKRALLLIFVPKAGFHGFCTIFPSIFHEKNNEKWIKKTIYFLLRRLFFSTWRPSRNNVFYITKATFWCFAFLRFFLKKRQKTCCKIETTFFPQKSPKSRPRGPVLGPKTVPN